MNDPAILFVKPKALKPTDKAALQKIGVVVIEVDNPNDVKLVRPVAEIPGSKLLEIACNVIANKSSSTVREAFGDAVASAVVEAAAKPRS